MTPDDLPLMHAQVMDNAGWVTHGAAPARAVAPEVARLSSRRSTLTAEDEDLALERAATIIQQRQERLRRASLRRRSFAGDAYAPGQAAQEEEQGLSDLLQVGSALFST